jgi:hypothetical protein
MCDVHFPLLLGTVYHLQEDHGLSLLSSKHILRLPGLTDYRIMTRLILSILDLPKRVTAFNMDY